MSSEIQDKTAFDELCHYYELANDHHEKKNICEKYGSKVGGELNEHGVFMGAKKITVIAHKMVDINITYIKTPYGYLASSAYSFKSGHMAGASSPITVHDATKGDYTQNLRDFAINAVTGILKSMQSDTGHPSLAPLKTYLKQSEQMSLFDDPHEPLVLS